MYVIMFIAAIVLRYKRPEVKRPYKIPFKNVGMWVVAGIGIIGTMFALIIGYIPPSQIEGFDATFYEIFLIGGTIIFCVIPFIIRFYRKPQWHLEHKKIMNKK